MEKRITFILAGLTLLLVVRAQHADTTRKSSLVLELPLIDYPYLKDAAKTVNGGTVSFGSILKGYRNPSMHQSLNVTADLYTGLHFGIKSIFDLKPAKWSVGKKLLYFFSITASDFVLSYAPGFDGWEHEEYHRAVMSRFQVNSFNDMNKFPLGAELVNVSHVKDEDLIRFKKEAPSDFIRMHVAGIEGEYLLIDKLQRNNFFYNQKLPHEIFYVITALNAAMYVRTSSDPTFANPLTNEINNKERSMPERDFTGLDFLGWAYDLFKPDEPYAARGIHPSGVGIDRYIKTTDLTSEELSYLSKQGDLQFLNLVSPMMFGLQSIKLSNDGLYGNFALHHLLTSFGNDISCNIYLMNSRHKLAFTYHSYQNYLRSYPAVEATMFDLEQSRWYISPRVLIGFQPMNQAFKTRKSDFIGLAECKFEYKRKGFINPFVELSLKTKGWIAGNEFLGSNVSFRLGLVSRIQIYKKPRNN